MVDNNNQDTLDAQAPSLPVYARVPFNRCNIPSVIVGSLIFQHHPVRIYIDGVRELHKQLFTKLDALKKQSERAQCFMDYMIVHFRLENLEDAGLTADLKKPGARVNADYLKMLRGWLFDTNGQEAAVMKGWVESRFGLLTRFHNGPLHSASATTDTYHNYMAFLESRSRGLYATNALEAQLDLVYSYCQYELALQYMPQQSMRLFRGVNRLQEYEILKQTDKRHAILLLNNLNSFTRNRERADEFGDYILEVDACWQKVMFYSDLLPGHFSGEEEVVMIGGVYEVDITL